MNEKVLKCLYDIKFAIDEIDSFFNEQTFNLPYYSNNLLVKRAVE